VRALLVAGVRLYREGLAHALARDGRIEVVGTAASVDQALSSLSDVTPDVILLDLTVAGALDGASDMMLAAPDAKVITLAVADPEQEVPEFGEVGVAAYVPREASLEDLVLTIQAAVRGECLCSPRVAAALLSRVATLAANPAGVPGTAAITPREQQVLDLVDQGLSNKEIAGRLLIEVATVKNHIHNILEKLGAHRRGEAVAMMRHRRPRRALVPEPSPQD
jgi:DNA-binding NarL/FixJ family response regulator